MGSTTNPQDGKKCPNCGAESTSGQGSPDGDGVGVLECHNENCAVDRFWGTREVW